MNETFQFLPTLEFLEELKSNNNKQWFDQNKLAYTQYRANFLDFIDFIIDELRDTDQLQGLNAKQSVFRINRDLRFSQDKSPYKLNFSASIAPGGKKSALLGYYISLEPNGQSAIAGGLYMPNPEQLKHFRQAIESDATAFKKIITSDSFHEQFGKIEGQRLKTAPKGYEQSHPEIDLLRLKQIFAMRNYTDQEVLNPDFPQQVLQACQALKPFLDYLNSL